MKKNSKLIPLIKSKYSYEGIGGSKDYFDCTISEKRQRQYNLYSDMRSLSVDGDIDNSLLDESLIEIYGFGINEIIDKLETLDGFALDVFMGTLLPVGTSMEVDDYVYRLMQKKLKEQSITVREVKG